MGKILLMVFSLMAGMGCVSGVPETSLDVTTHELAFGYVQVRPRAVIPACIRPN